MAEGETAGNLGICGFSSGTHSTGKEKTPVLGLTARNGVRMDERDAADSSFCGCQTAGFCEKQVAGFHVKRHLGGKADDTNTVFVCKCSFQTMLEALIISCNQKNLF